MKIIAIKQEVYHLTNTNNTQHLKKERPELLQGRDLRYKQQWLEILEQVKHLRQQEFDISLDDLEKSAQNLKRSLIAVGKMAGLSDEKIEIDWTRIKLESSFGDIHIEEL
jgi:hypothetical protein